MTICFVKSEICEFINWQLKIRILEDSAFNFNFDGDQLETYLHICW